MINNSDMNAGYEILGKSLLGLGILARFSPEDVDDFYSPYPDMYLIDFQKKSPSGNELREGLIGKLKILLRTEYADYIPDDKPIQMFVVSNIYRFGIQTTREATRIYMQFSFRII